MTTDIKNKDSELMKKIGAIGVLTDRDNANVGNNFSAKLLRIASESNKAYILGTIPEELRALHENLDLYYHDLDSYNLTVNCLHIPTRKMLEEGFNTGYGTLNRPKRIETAAELSCILLQSTQNDMFGGQSHPNFDNDLSLFVEPTRKEIYEELYSVDPLEEESVLKSKTESILEQRIHQAMQGVVYNLNTMHARAGSQVPFSSVNIGIPESKDAALVCKAFLEEYDKGLGKGEQPIFPNIIFRVKEGVNREKNDPYYYLFGLACKVAAKRMNPTFMNVDADFNKEHYDMGFLPATMGCRTRVQNNINGAPTVEGRGNNAPTTINMPRLAIKAMSIEDEAERVSKFFELFKEKITQARQSLLHRFEVQKKLKVRDLPFVIGQGLMRGAEGLKADDSIEPILRQGTYGIGFIGLAETLIALIGEHHGQSEKARELGLRIIQYLKDSCDEFTITDKLNWSCYATPAEGLSGKFTPVDREKYGVIEGVTDKDFYTNSFHIPVNFPIALTDKIQIEAPYHKLCGGGHISYVELDGYPTGNTIKSILQYAFSETNIGYLGINFHIRYCKPCGTYMTSEKNCPKCGSYDIQGVSRVTGYLSLDERFGPGKEAERALRMDHNKTHVNNYTVSK